MFLKGVLNEQMAESFRSNFITLVNELVQENPVSPVHFNLKNLRHANTVALHHLPNGIVNANAELVLINCPFFFIEFCNQADEVREIVKIGSVQLPYLDSDSNEVEVSFELLQNQNTVDLPSMQGLSPDFDVDGLMMLFDTDHQNAS